MQDSASKSGYYFRESSRNSDGSRLYAVEGDKKNERSAQQLIEECWGCKLHRWPDLHPIDWYAEADGRMVAMLEMKGRTHTSTHFPTVFLNFRKWSVMMAQCSMAKLPAIFVVRFTDEIRWVPLPRINPNATNGYIRIAGCSERVKSDTDIEPIIEVPVRDMLPLTKQHGALQALRRTAFPR